MNKKVVGIIKIVGFVLCTGALLSICLSVINYKDVGGGVMDRFNKLPKNSADVIFFGTSHAHCTVDQGLLWDEYGISGFTLSTGSQPVDDTRSFVEYALSTQKPRVIAIELYGATADALQTDYVSIFRNLTGMKWSMTYFKRSMEMADDIGGNFDQKFELLTKFPLVHYRYREIVKSDFHDNLPFLMGYRGSVLRESFDTPATEDWNGMNDIPESIEKELDAIIKMGNDKGAEVLFWASPFELTQPQEERLNAIEVYAKERGVAFINFNKMYEEIEFDFQTDMRDFEHTNNSGAGKVTKYLGDYLTSTYNLDDHRGDEYYEKWEVNSKYLEDRRLRFALNEEMTFNEYLSKIVNLDPHYTVGIVFKGNYLALPELFGMGVVNMGITEEDYLAGGYFINEKGSLICKLTGDYSENYPTRNGEIYVDSEKDSIWAEGTEYQLPENSIGIYLYDNEIGYLVDVAKVDVYYVGDMVEHFEIEDE